MMMIMNHDDGREQDKLLRWRIADDGLLMNC